MGHVFEFNGLLLDPRERALSRGRERIALRPRAFGVLSLLVENAGSLVDKQLFHQRVWGGLAVSDEVLKVAVREVRAALDDDPRQPRFIETVTKGGYRFVAGVTRRPRGAAPEPGVKYVRRDGRSIAYQTWGAGPIDLVYVAGWVSHLELQWAHPASAAFLQRLGRDARVISFDKRGTGLSDRMEGSPPLEERMEDLRTVMEAVGSRSAVLFGVSEASAMCALFAARHPSLVRSLVLYGATARAINGPGYTAGIDQAVIDGAGALILAHWGEPLFLEAEAPSAATDPGLRAFWAKLLRSSASPNTAKAVLDANAALDISRELAAIRVPTLVLHRRGDLMMPLEGARYLAERIPGARLRELSGQDHLPFVGDVDELFAALDEFLDAPLPDPA